MGISMRARCLDCGGDFELNEDGGFFFHLLRCDKCGGTKAVGFDELGDLHVRYVKGLDMPYCGASAEGDRYIQEHVPVEPLSEHEYHSAIEAVVGECKCGGHYTFGAPPRCPNCLSTHIDKGEVFRCYD